MAQSVRSTWQTPGGPIFEMQHRSEDQVLIQHVLREMRPRRALELGTAGGGFTALLAETLGEWKGWVTTFDKFPEPGIRDRLLAQYQNLIVEDEDVLVDGGAPLIRAELEQAIPFAADPTRTPIFLYCDNGHKQRELELYAPLMGPRALLGIHDYGTEVDPAWVEPFLKNLDFEPHRHAEFLALAHPRDYPDSLTRFWIRA
jgi:cephalosporin hydroxylase